MSGRPQRAARLALSLLAVCGAASLAGPPEPAQGRQIALGSYVPNAAWRPAQIDTYTRLMGRQPVIVGLYKQWDFAPFVGRELRPIWNRGSIPMITWEPMSYLGNHYSLRGIARGRYDGYVRKAARNAAAWGKPVLLRFAHEMNGDWYPWGTAGNSPRRFKIAWKRVVRIFRNAGADNVKWVWVPNINQFGGMPFKRYFPGDRWVDWVGLDGFNWGYGGSSYSFMELFGRSYNVLKRISSRPMIIAETGTNNRGKPRWIRQAIGRQLPRLGRIKALVWFNMPVNGVDLRFSSSRASLRAFRSSAAAPRYGLDRQELLRVR